VGVSGPEREASQVERHIISREPELFVLRSFLESEPSATCLVVAGDAGIGKTTLWEAGVEAAEALGCVVLSARASEAEVTLSFAVLADLLDGVEADVLAGLPAPQLDALKVALRKRDPVGAGPDRFAIATGFLSALRAQGAHGPLLVAIDDVQWLDPSSADCLLFAVRRLSGSQVRFLVTTRSDRRSEFERAMPAADVQLLELTPLSLGATSRLLSERFGLVLRHRVLRQVHEASQGNPLFALELGRLLVTGGIPEAGSELPVPELADHLFETRVRALPPAVGRALLAVTLSAGMSRSELCTLVDPLAVEDALSSGLLVVDRSRVRPAHPLLAAAARRRSSARERQALHLLLASAVSDATLRARHLAMATVQPDEDVARVVAAAAELAIDRGAVHDAEELGAQALRLTPLRAQERPSRLLALARLHSRADDMAGVTDLLTKGMDEMPPGRLRALAHLLLGDAGDAPEDAAHVELALAEAGEDPEVRALALAKKSRLLTVGEVERLDEAETWALEAVSAAQLVSPELEDRTRTALGWARILRGRPIDDLELRALTREPLRMQESSIDLLIGLRFVFRGQLDEARGLLQQPLSLAEERGDLQMVRWLQQRFCEIELRAGRVREAAWRLREMGQGPQWMKHVRARLEAVRAATAGDPTGARRFADVVLRSKSGHVMGWDRLEAMRAVGLAALFEQDAVRAIGSLKAVWEHTLNEHVDDPGAFPVAGDLVEALILAGEAAGATQVTERLRQRAVEQQHPWGIATTERCVAVVELNDRYLDEAAASLAAAADAYGELGLGFDRARSLLYLGRVQRRFKKRAAARGSLEEAALQFEQDGCSGWTAQARSELERVSGRKPAGEADLTPSEQQVVELAAEGLSNKEIAGRLFVTVYTVEAHLSHAYAKLGIRSRSQLARRLDSSPE